MRKNVSGLEVKTEGDAPLPMKIAMIGTAALCVAIGVYPAMLFNILPVHMPPGEAYVPYALEHVLEASLVLGAAVLFFFTIGVRVLKPRTAHEIPELDVAYRAGGRGVEFGARGISRGFGVFYDGVSHAGNGLVSLGRKSMWFEGKDVNWNIVAFALVIVLLLGVTLLGVT